MRSFLVSGLLLAILVIPCRALHIPFTVHGTLRSVEHPGVTDFWGIRDGRMVCRLTGPEATFAESIWAVTGFRAPLYEGYPGTIVVDSTEWIQVNDSIAFYISYVVQDSIDSYNIPVGSRGDNYTVMTSSKNIWGDMPMGDSYNRGIYYSYSVPVGHDSSNHLIVYSGGRRIEGRGNEVSSSGEEYSVGFHYLFNRDSLISASDTLRSQIVGFDKYEDNKILLFETAHLLGAWSYGGAPLFDDWCNLAINHELRQLKEDGTEELLLEFPAFALFRRLLASHDSFPPIIVEGLVAEDTSILSCDWPLSNVRFMGIGFDLFPSISLDTIVTRGISGHGMRIENYPAPSSFNYLYFCNTLIFRIFHGDSWYIAFSASADRTGFNIGLMFFNSLGEYAGKITSPVVRAGACDIDGDGNEEIWTQSPDSDFVIHRMDSILAEVEQEENDERVNFRAYPNPATTEIQLTWLDPHQSTDLVRLIDLNGSVVITKYWASSGPLKLDVSALQPGVYWIQSGMHRVRVLKM